MPFSFLHPMLFAIGAACVSIPIMIHLLKRRRRVITWGAMRFLEEAYRKRRRIITLEQLILLSMRCLLVLLIALGVGALVLGGGGASRVARTLIIVLDDSIASARVVNIETMLDRNIEAAIDQIDDLDPSMGDRVVLISASAPASPVVLPASDDLGAVRALVEQSASTDAAFDLDGVLGLMAQFETDPDRPSETSLLIASDSRAFDHAFEQVRSDPTRVPVDSVLIPEPGQETAVNVGIVKATPTRSLVVRDGLSLPESVQVELVRTGEVVSASDTQIEIVDMDGARRGTGVLAWRAGEREAAVNIAIDTSGLEASAATSALLQVRTGEDANPRDNEALIALPTRNTLRVAVVDRPRAASGSARNDIQPSRWVRAALAPRSDMGVQITSIDVSRAAARLAPSVDAIFVLAPAELNDAAWDRISRLRDQGVMLVTTPDSQSESLAWFDRVQQLAADSFAPLQQIVMHEVPVRVDPSLSERSLLSGVSSEWDELAGAVEIHRSLALGSNATPIATLSDGSPLGVQVVSGDGSGVLVFLAVPFDLGWSNLPARPLFVAMMQELVRQGVGIGETRSPVIAGAPISSPDWFESARRIELQDQPLRVDPDRSAGAIAFRDAQGQARAIQIIQPDALGASADRVDPTVIDEQLARFIDSDGIRWLGSADESSASSELATRRGSNAHKIALWILWAALFIGVLEFILARLFTQRLIASEQAMGAEGRGARA